MTAAIHKKGIEKIQRLPSKSDASHLLCGRQSHSILIPAMLTLNCFWLAGNFIC